MDYESQASMERGCWDGSDFCSPAIDALAAPVGDDWVVDDDFVLGVLAAGLGDSLDHEDVLAVAAASAEAMGALLARLVRQL